MGIRKKNKGRSNRRKYKRQAIIIGRYMYYRRDIFRKTDNIFRRDHKRIKGITSYGMRNYINRGGIRILLRKRNKLFFNKYFIKASINRCYK